MRELSSHGQASMRAFGTKAKAEIHARCLAESDVFSEQRDKAGQLQQDGKGYTPDTGSSGWFKKPYCYSTRRENIVNGQSKYKTYVEGVYQIRKREIDYFVDSHADLLAAFTDVYLIDNSEGAMVASRYHHPEVDKLLKVRILNSWSCKFN